jgi:hypothetical protein
MSYACHVVCDVRYAGPQPPPAALCAGSRVFSTERLRQLVDDQVRSEEGGDGGSKQPGGGGWMRGGVGGDS